MKVLVAGLSKTGTKTMTAALSQLGYEVYDFMENFYYLGEEWEKQVRKGFRKEDLRRMYENVDAVTDCPCDRYWEEIFDAFPDVKVILTTRDDESWIKSLKNQVEEINTDFKYRLARTITYIGLKVHRHYSLSASHLGTIKPWPTLTASPFHDETVIRYKQRHERNVKMIVPEDQLLVYEVTEGWESLCDFLGLPVPDIPFPHKNKGCTVFDEMRKENVVMQRIERELKFTLVCLFAIFALAFCSATSLFC